MSEDFKEILVNLPWFTLPIIVWIILFILICLASRLKYKQLFPIKIWQFWISSVLSFPAAYFFGGLLLILLLSYTPSRQFTSEEWINDPEIRIELIDDLIDRRILDGMSEKDVIELLGESIANCDYFTFEKYDMIYNLGPERGFIRIDSEWLLIWLGNDIVKRYKIRRD